MKFNIEYQNQFNWPKKTDFSPGVKFFLFFYLNFFWDSHNKNNNKLNVENRKKKEVFFIWIKNANDAKWITVQLLYV